jgi:nickel-dependent lactate racemase
VPEIRVPYGKTYLSAQVASSHEVVSLAPRSVEAAADPLATVRAALGDDLSQFARTQSVAIAVNDKTRPVPHAHLLPPLLEQLNGKDITFVIANGAHPPMTPDEYPQILPPEIIAQYKIVSHDCEDAAMLVNMGQTARGTPVLINKAYASADVRLVVGNVEPHQIMGFSGGVKSAAIGLAGKATITANHAMMTHENARLGHYDDNPARADVEEIGRMIGVDFALNALLNAQKQIVEVIAGQPLAVMQQAIPLIRKRFQIEVDAPFDVTVASAGGHPKDINLYQAQKALAHAAIVTRDGGTVILVAACPEGTGSIAYENFVLGMTSHAEVLHRFSDEGFRIGAHKAYQIARDAARLHVMMISEMDADFVKQLLLTPAASLQDALDTLPPHARIAVMPAANATIPVLKRIGVDHVPFRKTP